MTQFARAFKRLTGRMMSHVWPASRTEAFCGSCSSCFVSMDVLNCCESVINYQSSKVGCQKLVTLFFLGKLNSFFLNNCNFLNSEPPTSELTTWSLVKTTLKNQKSRSWRRRSSAWWAWIRSRNPWGPSKRVNIFNKWNGDLIRRLSVQKKTSKIGFGPEHRLFLLLYICWTCLKRCFCYTPGPFLKTERLVFSRTLLDLVEFGKAWNQKTRRVSQLANFLNFDSNKIFELNNFESNLWKAWWTMMWPSDT